MPETVAAPVPEPTADEAGFDALLLVTFGGPDGPDDVLPFLRNVTRGRGVPEERINEVAEHYRRVGGRSPINDQSRALLAALREELAPLPVYWGNRNWKPFLADTVAEMAADGVRRAACFIPSVFATYSGCRQYRENLADALAGLPAGGPELTKLRVFFDHPGYLEPVADRVVEALGGLPEALRETACLVYVAHSVPHWQAEQSGPEGGAYPAQFAAASEVVTSLVAARTGQLHASALAYCSRSGPPRMSWLEPDIGDRLEQLAAAGTRAVVIVPLGFVSDHMEVVADLDHDAMSRASALRLAAVRSATVGTDPRFVGMISELLGERCHPGAARRAMTSLGPFPDVCPALCCAPRTGERRPAAAGTPEDAAGGGQVRVDGPPAPGTRILEQSG